MVKKQEVDLLGETASAGQLKKNISSDIIISNETRILEWSRQLCHRKTTHILQLI